MARVKNGVLGGFSGKVGEVIGQNYAGISTMRAMPKYVTNPRTPAQEAHRALMASAGAFLAPFSWALSFSTWAKSKVKNGFNETLRKNFGKWRLDPQDGVLLNIEGLELGEFIGEPLASPSVTLQAIHDGDTLLPLELQWSNNQTSPYANDDDLVFLWAVLEDDTGKYRPLCAVDTGATRGDTSVSLKIAVPADLENGQFIWFATSCVSVCAYTTGRNPYKPTDIINIPSGNSIKHVNIPARNVTRYKAGDSLRKAVAKSNS